VRIALIFLDLLSITGSGGRAAESNLRGSVEISNEQNQIERTKMPEKTTVEKAKEDLREGKSPTTAAGEFVHEEIQHVREGKHGARSPQQAIAIGLSKARRAGIPLRPPARGRAPSSTRRRAARDYRRGQSSGRRRPSRRRSRATAGALRREKRSSASRSALARQTRGAARRRSRASRSQAARRAAATRRRHTGRRR